jgi:signal transduction histidine kinase/CheY-like chemotaxis protein
MSGWFKTLLIPQDASLPPLAYWRERVLRATLVAGSAGALVAYVPGVILAWQADHHLVAVVDTVCYLIILAMALRPGLPFGVRAGSLVVIPAVIALALMAFGGSVAAGSVWLASFPIMAALFFGLRPALVALGVQAAMVTAIGFAVGLGYLDWGGALATYPQGVTATWLVTGTNILLISIVLSLSGAVLLQALEGTALEEATARRNLERETEERQQLQNRLRQGEKLEAMGTLAGGIAHDFNNLLVPILLRSREAMDALPEHHPAQEALGDVHISASRARDMVRRILVFSRGGESSRDLVEVDREVAEVAALLRSSLPSTIEMELDLQAPGAQVLAASSELHQVIMNLATNGYHAMKEGGGALRMATRIADGTVEVRISDTGPGMPPEVLERVFEPFFTTRPEGEGTGLGLATVFRVVSGMQGTVALNSQEGQGTTATVLLPMASAVAVAGTRADGAAASREGQGAGEEGAGELTAAMRERHRLAVVDDDAVVLRATTALLRRLGYQVAAFPLPDAALRYLENADNPVDLLFTDYIMPGMTGLELAEATLRVRPGVPVLLSSGNLEGPVRDRVTAVGVSGVLGKPYEVAELDAAIQRALDLDR